MKNKICDNILQEIHRHQIDVEKKQLSKYACKSSEALYFGEKHSDVRPPYFHDTDKVLYSSAYTRYVDKTQVFYLVENDHITHRVLHVQLVSKIAKTIGRFLFLNEDLIEAIALGHDVGHAPFGHNGESIISRFCEENNSGIFEHNVQSFRLFYELENFGKGCNMTVQMLDGVICHNGEILSEKYECNRAKEPETLLSEYKRSLNQKGISSIMVPMTLEGCVVRISDIIAYIGRDIEDAVSLKLIDRASLPREATEILGENNGDIVNNLIVDLVNNSFDQDYIAFSSNCFRALKTLKEWNYENIYNNPRKKAQDEIIDRMFRRVLKACVKDIDNSTNLTGIKDFLKEMNDDYRIQNVKYRMVADYVAGMTDDYLMNVNKNICVPVSFGYDFGER